MTDESPSTGPPCQKLPEESDPLYPSGEWTGFFLQRQRGARRSWMSLALSFAEGRLTGEGADWVGKFTMRGGYSTESGEVTIHKFYIGGHHVFYRGFNEGEGIWGVWEIKDFDTGGFHIWPQGMPDPTHRRIACEVDEPVPVLTDPVLTQVVEDCPSRTVGAQACAIGLSKMQ